MILCYGGWGCINTAVNAVGMERKRTRRKEEEEECASFICSCQKLSEALKSKRTAHPERAIGRSKTTVANSDDAPDEDTAEMIYCEFRNLIFTQSCLECYKERPFAQYFMFSLLFDLLKVEDLGSSNHIQIQGELASLLANTIPYWSSSSCRTHYIPLLDKQLSILVKLISLLSKNVIERGCNSIAIVIDPSNVHKIAHHVLYESLAECKHVHEKINWDICAFVNEYDITPSIWGTILNSLLVSCESLLKVFDHWEQNVATVTISKVTDLETKIDELFFIIFRSLMNMIAKIDARKLMQLSSESDQTLVSSLLKFLEIQLRINMKQEGISSSISLDKITNNQYNNDEYDKNTIEKSRELRWMKLTELTTLCEQRQLHSFSVFFHFCMYAICLDHSLALDLMTSPETDCLLYFLRITKQILAADAAFTTSFWGFLKSSMEVSPTLRGEQGGLRGYKSSSTSCFPVNDKSRVAVILTKQFIIDASSSASIKSHKEVVAIDWNVSNRNRNLDEHQYQPGHIFQDIYELHSKFLEFFNLLAQVLTNMHTKRLLPFDPTLLTKRFLYIVNTLSQQV